MKQRNIGISSVKILFYPHGCKQSFQNIFDFYLQNNKKISSQEEILKSATKKNSSF